MEYEYKSVGAPERLRHQPREGSASDALAKAVSEILRREAVEGWEYFGSELLPVSERRGLFGRTEDRHRTILVFRRAKLKTIAQPAPRKTASSLFSRAKPAAPTLRALPEEEPDIQPVLPKISMAPGGKRDDR